MPLPRQPFDLDRHLFFWLTQVTAARDVQLASALKAFGVRVPEWRALAALDARRHCTMSQLAELAAIDRTTLTRTVDRMQDAGWLTRVADGDDLRVTRLSLTAAGQKLFGRIWPVVERLNRAALAGLPVATVEGLRDTLAQMKRNLDVEPAAAARAA
jgi:DNA-binding MarR family transcriptional regulator